MQSYTFDQRRLTIWQSGSVRLPDRIPAVWLVVAGIISVQVGAAIAKDLFDLVPPTAMVWLRLITSAVILLLMARPRLTGHSGRDWLVVLGFGVTLMTMNWAIYQSFARLPLGIAVTIEFLGPLTVAVIGSRRVLDLIWVTLAGAGVALLGVSRASLTVAGVGFALLAAVAWALYILIHPAERADRTALAGYQRSSHCQHGRSHRIGTSGHCGGRQHAARSDGADAWTGDWPA